MDGRPARWDGAGKDALPTSDRQLIQSVAAVLSSIDQLLPPDVWHLKGSAAILGWIGPTARLPNDVDLAMSASAGELLLSTSELPPGPKGERLQLLRSEPVVFSSPDKATVYRALVKIQSGEDHEQVLLNVLLVPDSEVADDTRTALLDFPAWPSPVTVPTATLSRCLAQKLLRYTRQRGGGKINTRWTDLIDFLLAAESPSAPQLLLDAVRSDVALEFTAMGRQWPTHLPPPPTEWLDFWDTATFRHGLAFGSLPEAVDQLAHFWSPVLQTPVAPYGPVTAQAAEDVPQLWSCTRWQWATP
ncbi:nucleotidyl transferase AbiEii/AbiGii toxin family protein [Streptomyces sp. 6N106]|uniref:nucleotidyl transferase AbiEii/AbiGii toxin family protein n=1 Tax=Streptomyces sp. 6N106 TaxID=3457418 RepID=UPI003FD57032